MGGRREEDLEGRQARRGRKRCNGGGGHEVMERGCWGSAGTPDGGTWWRRVSPRCVWEV